MRRTVRRTLGAMLILGWGLPVGAQGRPDPAATLAAQRTAMAALAAMDGVWRGSASVVLPSGEKRTLVQTERVGPFLEGSVKVIEGRGYASNGELEFNAVATISFDPATKAYRMHSYAQGNVGDFEFVPGSEGFTWTIPAGPMTIRYTATVKDGHWREVGERLMPGKDPVRFFEAELDRVGSTDWPAAGAVGPR